jgi:glutamate racemase
VRGEAARPTASPAGAAGAREASSRPIGVFDSGVGGLTVVAALQRLLPRESILYLGDTARLPYGTKSPQTVLAYSKKNVDFLVGRGVKAVVVACNTASAVAVGELKPPVPLWGVLGPGAARAAAVSRGKVGVIATESTIDSDAYGRELRRLRPDVEVVSQPCPLFVPLVEEGWHDDPVAAEVARRYLAPLAARDIDTLVLGCTHYPLLRRVIAEVMGPGVTLVDSAEAVAEVVAADLLRHQLARDESSEQAEHHFCVTDAGTRFAKIGARFLGADALSLEWVDV